MKNRLYIILIGILSSLISSCQQSADEEIVLPPNNISITFTLAFDELSSATRAAWSSNETASDASPGNEFENQIDLTSENGLQVFIYSTDGQTCLSKVTDEDIVRLEENGRIVYQFTGDALIDSRYIQNNSLNCRLMVFANCDKIDTTSGLTGLYYEFDANAFRNQSQYIPMWGVKQCTLNLSKGDLSMVDGYIYLLRSMAKVEVKLDSSIADQFDLNNVSVSAYNIKSNVLPNGYAAATTTEAMDMQSVFNPNTSAKGSNLYFTKVSNDEYCLYLPEYQNVEADAATMTVRIDNNDYPLEFKDYENNTPFNIVRNHCYQYIITGISTKENVLLLYQSIPWTDVSNRDLTFGNGDGNAMN